MTEKKCGNITQTQLIEQAGIGKDPAAVDDFVESYRKFLSAIIWKGCIFTGHRNCAISAPFNNKDRIITELQGLMVKVCNDFLNNKVTPEFIGDIRKTHRGKAARHISVRTTLQIMFANALKKNPVDTVIVSFENGVINLYLKKEGFEPGPYYPEDLVREMLRHFRCLLTRLAGEGDLSVYPTPYQCYCLYHDCFGTDRKKVVQSYLKDQDEKEQQKFLKAGDWNDAMVGALLNYLYEGKRQLRNNRRISCDRKTINNRRREYQKHLSKCILHYLPDANPEVIKQMLDKRNVDADTVITFCKDFIRSIGMSEAEAADNMKTRTLEVPE